MGGGGVPGIWGDLGKGGLCAALGAADQAKADEHTIVSVFDLLVRGGEMEHKCVGGGQDKGGWGKMDVRV
jgi:hypothetical protein